MSSNTEGLMVKITIYTHARTHTHTLIHFAVIQLCTQVSVSSFLSGFTGDSLPVSHSLTHKKKQTGEMSGAVAVAGAPIL